jgi:hypothetical protein
MYGYWSVSFSKSASSVVMSRWFFIIVLLLVQVSHLLFLFMVFYCSNSGFFQILMVGVVCMFCRFVRHKKVKGRVNDS